jgi:hypothetical protein
MSFHLDDLTRLAWVRTAQRQSAQLFRVTRIPMWSFGWGALYLMEVPMKQFAIATLFLVGLTAPVFAATMAQQDATDTSPNFDYHSKDHWAVIDTVGNCAVVDTKPSSYGISGLKMLGNSSGYPSLSAAQQQIKSNMSVCKGTIERA